VIELDTIDLHTHSSISDGTLAPAELIAYAKEKNLCAIALTDHDTIEGIPEAMESALRHNIELVAGIELSAYYQHTELHILGLDIDHQDPKLLFELQQIQNSRVIRNQAMIDKMSASGIDITMSKLIDLEGEDILTRMHFANYLVHVGFAGSVREAFDKHIGKGGLFYVARKRISPDFAIKLILDAGGIPILAHPLLYHFNDEKLDANVKHLTACGLEGIEVYYSMNNGFDEIRMKRLANKYGLKYSGGSDYHGANKPHIDLGSGRNNLNIPYRVLEALRQR